MTGYSLVFPAAGRVELVREEVAGPSEGQVLCAAERSLISTGTELQCLRGVSDPGTNWERWVRYPFRPGYCMAARVLETGEEVFDYLLDGRMHVEQLISHVLPFSEAPKIYQSLREDRSKYMGVLFDWTSKP